MFALTLFIFRRDFRLDDNTGLLFALEHSKQVICSFIFTPEQIKKNSYRGDHCLQFMLESLEDLQKQLETRKGKLFFFWGDPSAIITKCVHTLHIDAVVCNRDYTPYSVERDKNMAKTCHAHHIAFHSFHDAVLHAPETIAKKDGAPYTIFTPYFRNASQQAVVKPIPNKATNYFHKSISCAKQPTLLTKFLPKRQESRLRGGRTEAVRILKNLSRLRSYKKEKDFPARDFSSHLSPYLKFTVVSVREVHAAVCTQLGKSHPLIRALYWRDFFTAIAFFFPHVFQGPFHKKFRSVKWGSSRALFQKWCNGATGFPIVDAGMRELNATGFLPNRVRMIVGSFLVKDLHLDWRWGEKYFARTLIDYDPSVNNGNWQWVASTGCDAQPYFRIFNPWTQQKKFDPACAYIKRWVPELKDVPERIIHHWDQSEHHPLYPQYPPPIVDHAQEAKRAIRLQRGY